ncbi:thiamine pyrophosphate-binding protein [Vibrio sp. PP-XX7]
MAGLGEALYHVNETLPTYRAHNEQAMAHSAIAFAKANNRRRMMAATTSVGPGALNMVTAAALAHVNRLPCYSCRAIPLPPVNRIQCSSR